MEMEVRKRSMSSNFFCSQLTTFSTDKRPFFVGSRYGRSQSDLTNMDSNGKSSNQRLVPRNDKFFFGSRYGKRSLPAVDEDQNQNLNCFYTGVTNLFRCVE